MSVFCQYCGAQMPEEAHVCSRCGAVYPGDSAKPPAISQEIETSEVFSQPEELIPEPPKAKKKMKWLIPVGTVVAVAVLGALLWKPVLKAVAPHAYVAVMMNNTNSALEKRMEKTPVGILSNSASSAMEEGNVSISMDMSDDDSMDISADMVLSSNLDDKKWSMDMNASANDMDIDMSVYMDSKVFAVDSDMLGDCYGITYSTFGDDLRDSAFGDLFDDDTIDLMSSGVEAVGDTMEYAGDYDELMKPYVDYLKDYIGDLDSVNGSESIQLGDTQKKCSTVAFTIDQDDLFEMINGMIDIVEDDSKNEALLETFASVMGGDLGDLLDVVRDGLDEVEDSIDTEAVITYYIYKSKVVNIKLELELEVNGETGEIEAELCYGANPKKDDIELRFTMNADDQERSVHFVFSDDWDGNNYKCKLTAEVKADGETLGDAEFAMKWNKKSGKLTMTVGNDEQDVLSCSLKLLKTKKGCELSIDDLYEFACEINPDFEDEDSIDGSLTISFAEGKTSISTPKFTNLDEIDEDALEDIRDHILEFGENF